jgi:replicative DNA helicase
MVRRAFAFSRRDMLNSDEELAVLGAILLDSSVFFEIDGYLNENDFYSGQNRLVYRAIVDLTLEGAPIDVLTVVARLRDNKCLTKAGGPVYVSSLTDSCPDPGNIKFYADKIIEQSTARELASIGKRILDGASNPRETLERAMSSIISLSDRAIVSREEPIGDLTGGVLNHLINGNEVNLGIKTGFGDLDKYIWGMAPGDLVLVGARPSVGKSAFALQVATNVARSGNQVLFVSPEMTKDQLSRRLLSVESGVSYKKILHGNKLSDREKGALQEAHKRIVTLPLVVDDGPHQTLADLRLKARRMQARAGLSMIVVDYLQLLCEGDDSKEAVTIVSRGLKAMAKDLSIPVFAASQLSRALSYREDQRPTLTDLRSSGQLDQDADLVLMMYHTTKEKDKVEIFLEKHRNGPLGGHIYNFNKDTTEFTSRGW